jgi:hypothetical protein
MKPLLGLFLKPFFLSILLWFIQCIILWWNKLLFQKRTWHGFTFHAFRWCLVQGDLWLSNLTIHFLFFHSWIHLLHVLFPIINTNLIPSFKKHNISTLDGFFWFLHTSSDMFWSFHNALKDTSFLFQNVNICFATKDYQMRHIEFPIFDPCVLWRSWIMDFGWASIFI